MLRPRPSLQTGRAIFPHPAFRSVVLIENWPLVPGLRLRRSARFRRSRYLAIADDRPHGHAPNPCAFCVGCPPFTSFNSSFEGCQHTFRPHTGFRPVRLGRNFSALFSLWHSRQVYLPLCVLHVSTFLPPLAPRSLPASSLLWGL